MFLTDGFLKKLGEIFKDWSKEVDGLYFTITGTKITPGSYGEAQSLKLVFEERKEDLKKELGKLRKVLFDVGHHLIWMESKYQNAEDINTDDIYRLYGLIDAVEATYPGAKSLLPAPPGGFPDAPKPKEPPPK